MRWMKSSAQQRRRQDNEKTIMAKLSFANSLLVFSLVANVSAQTTPPPPSVPSPPSPPPVAPSPPPLVPPVLTNGSCYGFCGAFSPNLEPVYQNGTVVDIIISPECFCDQLCKEQNNCCDDVDIFCPLSPSCKGNCGGFTGKCYCDFLCTEFNDCCDDYCATCEEYAGCCAADHSSIPSNYLRATPRDDEIDNSFRPCGGKSSRSQDENCKSERTLNGTEHGCCCVYNDFDPAGFYVFAGVHISLCRDWLFFEDTDCDDPIVDQSCRPVIEIFPAYEPAITPCETLSNETATFNISCESTQALSNTPSPSSSSPSSSSSSSSSLPLSLSSPLPSSSSSAPLLLSPSDTGYATIDLTLFNSKLLATNPLTKNSSAPIVEVSFVGFPVVSSAMGKAQSQQFEPIVNGASGFQSFSFAATSFSEGKINPKTQSDVKYVLAGPTSEQEGMFSSSVDDGLFSQVVILVNKSEPEYFCVSSVTAVTQVVQYMPQLDILAFGPEVVERTVTTQFEPSCRSCTCISDYVGPVCGCEDGITYENACDLYAAGRTVAYRGPCCTKNQGGLADGKVKISDVSAVLGVVLGNLPAENSCVFATGDVNNDTVIDVNDVLPALSCVVDGTLNAENCALCS